MSIVKKPIPGYPGYFAGDDGNIYGRQKGDIITPLSAYLSKRRQWVQLRHKATETTHKFIPERVAKLVLLAWAGARPQGHAIVHLNDNEMDNRPENLAYVKTQYQVHKEYLAERKQNGTYNMRKISFDMADEIRTVYASGNFSYSQLARIYDIDQSTISLIVNNKRRVRKATE